MAKRVSVPKSPFPYELRDDLAELARYLAPEGALKPGVPSPGDSPVWDTQGGKGYLEIGLAF